MALSRNQMIVEVLLTVTPRLGGQFLYIIHKLSYAHVIDHRRIVCRTFHAAPNRYQRRLLAELECIAWGPAISSAKQRLGQIADKRGPPMQVVHPFLNAFFKPLVLNAERLYVGVGIELFLQRIASVNRISDVRSQNGIVKLLQKRAQVRNDLRAKATRGIEGEELRRFIVGAFQKVPEKLDPLMIRYAEVKPQSKL